METKAAALMDASGINMLKLSFIRCRLPYIRNLLAVD